MPESYDEPQFFLVWREGSEPHTPTRKHGQYQQALDEATRLTRQTGVKFHVLCHMATVEKIDVAVTEVVQLPF